MGLICQPNREIQSICRAQQQGGGNYVRALPTATNTLDKAHVELAPLPEKVLAWVDKDSEFSNLAREMAYGRIRKSGASGARAT